MPGNAQIRVVLKLRDCATVCVDVLIDRELADRQDGPSRRDIRAALDRQYGDIYSGAQIEKFYEVREVVA